MSLSDNDSADYLKSAKQLFSPSISALSHNNNMTGSEGDHLIAADSLSKNAKQRQRDLLLLKRDSSLDAQNTSARPVVSFREITSYSVKIAWQLESTTSTDQQPSQNDVSDARFTLYFDIPGDSERFRPLYHGPKNRVKITGLRRSTIYRLFIRVALGDPRLKDAGSFAAFSTQPDVKLHQDGPANDHLHMKGLLAYANPKQQDDAVLSIPSFRAAMWCRRYCSLSSLQPSQLKLDAEYAWQHYKWTAKENSWTEIKRCGFKNILQQNLLGVKFNEIDFCNIELQEFSQDEDFHSVIKDAQKSAQCWRSPDCVPCSIGALHLCQASEAIYWLSCDLCGADYLGKTSGHTTLSETLTGQHRWVRGHFTEQHASLFLDAELDYDSDLSKASSEDVVKCFDHVTGVVVQLQQNEVSSQQDIGRSLHRLVKKLRPSDNGIYNDH